MNDFLRLNIALIPPKNISDVVIQISKKISEEFETYFALDGINFFPHMTIYSPEYPKESLVGILDKLEEVTRELNPITLAPIKISAEEKGYLDIEMENSIEILDLHKYIIEVFNGFRRGHLRDKYKDEEYLSKLSIGEQQNIEVYGYPLVLDFFRPHLTITRFVDESLNTKIKGEIESSLHPFQVDEIGIFEMGENGTCVNLVRKFKLNGDTR